MLDTSTTSQTVRRLYEAYNAQDVDAAIACWREGGTEFWPMTGEVTAKKDLHAHLTSFYASFPDSTIVCHDMIAAGDRVATQVTLSGTFSGAPFQGFRANGRPWATKMAEIFTVTDGLIDHLDVHWDFVAVAEQIGFMPPMDSRAGTFFRGTFNARVRAGELLHRRRPRA
jgi:predicted ester cyclase